jgi:hypothetical protein
MPPTASAALDVETVRTVREVSSLLDLQGSSSPHVKEQSSLFRSFLSSPEKVRQN